MIFSIPHPVSRTLHRLLALALALASTSGAAAGEPLGGLRDGHSWAPVLLGVVAGVALSELVRVFFRCLAYGWFTLWFTGMRLLQYGLIAGVALAFFYFK